MDLSKLKLVKKEKQKKKGRKPRIEVENYIYECIVQHWGARVRVKLKRISDGEIVYIEELPLKHLTREFSFLDYQYGEGSYKIVKDVV